MWKATAASKNLDSRGHTESPVNKGVISNHLKAWRNSQSIRDDKDIINHQVQPFFKNNCYAGRKTPPSLVTRESRLIF